MNNNDVFLFPFLVSFVLPARDVLIACVSRARRVQQCSAQHSPLLIHAAIALLSTLLAYFMFYISYRSGISATHSHNGR